MMGCFHGRAIGDCLLCEVSNETLSLERVRALATQMYERLSELEYDRRRALRRAYEVTPECQTCDEAVADLVRQIRDARHRRDGADHRALVAETRLKTIIDEASGWIAKDFPPTMVKPSTTTTDGKMWVDHEAHQSSARRLAMVVGVMKERAERAEASMYAERARLQLVAAELDAAPDEDLAERAKALFARMTDAEGARERMGGALTDDARAAERAAIVAWLRASGPMLNVDGATVHQDIAARIEHHFRFGEK